MSKKPLFEKETEKPIDDQFVRHAPFALTTRMLRSAANNGDLVDGEFYEKFFMHIGQSSNQTRFYQSLTYLAAHGYKPSKALKNIFDKGYYGKDWETAKKFTFDTTNLAMFEETIYDLVAVVNMRDYVEQSQFDQLDPQAHARIIENLDVLEQRVVEGESINSCLLKKTNGNQDIHTQIDNLCLKNYGVNFRQPQPTTVLWDGLQQHISKDARREFVLNYAANGVNVSIDDPDCVISMRCMDSMLDEMAYKACEHKSKMCINAAVRYSNNTQFSPYKEPEGLSEIY